MPSKNTLKQYIEDSYYHIYNRGVNKERIFLDDQDYKTFLRYLKMYLSLSDLQGDSLKVKVAPSRQLKNYTDQIKLIAYCLLPNHFHLLIWQNEFDKINFFMRSLATKYARYFNRKYHRVGPVFQSVYKAVLVESEDQLLYLTKYIHRNPIELLPTRSLLVGYKYSSYGNYLNLFNQVWVKPLDFINKSYKTFVEETDERDLLTIKSVLIEEI
ncbi:MAG: transposase [Candidatus Beckwithbacteria bacterium]